VKFYQWLALGLISFLTTLLLSGIFPSPTIAHINDLSLADVEVSAQEATVKFTLPIDFIRFADDNENGQIEAEEVWNHQENLEKFLRDRAQISNQNNTVGTLRVQPASQLIVPSYSEITADTHTTLILAYSWTESLETLNFEYNLFPTNLGMGFPSLPTAHRLATIRWEDNIKTHVFNITNKQLTVPLNLSQTSLGLPFLDETQGGFLAIFGALIWGSFHALSPGHGKTMISAYLAGTKATLNQAIALGLTTTITHTIGVFAFGLITWFASQYILPEQLSPWLTLLSGILIFTIGFSLIRKRLRKSKHHHHHHHHEVSVASWREIFALGISGGLVPCPAATVLLLSTIALGQIAYGLLLVLVFSLGLALTLIGLGVLFIHGKKQFEKLPKGEVWLQKLTVLSAIVITLVGTGITGQAILTLI